MTSWHEPTQEEIEGQGGHAFIVDIQPDIVPYQASRDGDALIRLSRPGWSWMIKDMRPKDKKDKASRIHIGNADTREGAVGDALAKLGELRQ